MWSCGVIERCENMSVSQHPLLATMIAQSGCQSEIALQVSLKVLQHTLCILHMLGIQS